MKLPRLARIFAIAWRDLRFEFKGKRSLILPLLSAMILVPLALAPPIDRFEPDRLTVSGDVPEAILELPHVHKTHKRSAIHFEQSPEGLGVIAWSIPLSFREVLDRQDPLPVVYLHRPAFRYPHRGLILALLAASTLIGALSQSIPGERSQKTLQTLLSASVTPAEIAIGKWLAWGGFGAAGTLLTSIMAVLAGHIEPGWWLLAAPWGPLSATALGLFLVRRARDVVGGATVALRMLPAFLAAAALFSFIEVDRQPWLAAFTPLGGVLMAAGDVFDDVRMVLLAIASTAVTSLVMLAMVARDLDPPPPSPAASARVRGSIDGGVLVLATMLGALSPVLWHRAGSEAVSLAMTPESGRIAVVCIALVWLGFASLRSPSPARPYRPSAIHAPILVLLTLALLALPHTTFPQLAQTLTSMAASEHYSALMPTLAAPFTSLLLVFTQEVVLRGRVQTLAGPVIACLLWVLVYNPFDPWAGLTSGVLLTVASMAGGWPLSLAGRLLALTPIFTLLPTSPWVLALALPALVALVWLTLRARAQGTA